MLFQRSLRLPQLLLIFFLYSSLLQLLPPFSPPAHFSALLPLSLCWFPPVYLKSVIVLFIVDCLFFNSYMSLLNTLASSSSMPPVYLSVFPFCFQDFWSSLLSLLCILFQVVYLFPRLFGLVGFYCVPSYAAYFSVFSFCLIYCIWGLFSAGWML